MIFGVAMQKLAMNGNFAKRCLHARTEDLTAVTLLYLSSLVI
jgi:hypothetical protein